MFLVVLKCVVFLILVQVQESMFVKRARRTCLITLIDLEHAHVVHALNLRAAHSGEVVLFLCVTKVAESTQVKQRNARQQTINAL